MIGSWGGVTCTSNPPALQKLTDKSHYVDSNGGLTSDYKTMKPYIDIIDDMKAKSMNKFNELFGSSQTTSHRD